MLADANGTYDALGTLDTFGLRLPSGGADQWCDGVPRQSRRAHGCERLRRRRCDLFQESCESAGSGLANNNTYWQQTSATGGSCISGATSGGGCGTVSGPIYGGLYMRITADLTDCNANLLPDAYDISAGTSIDSNLNGIPDECESSYTTFCFCPAAQSPCGNGDPNAGCANSTGAGASMTPTGTTSAGSDDLVLTTNGIPPFKSSIGYWSAAVGGSAPFYDGLRCLFAPAHRLLFTTSDASGTVVYGPGLATAQGFVAGMTIGFQVWYRDPTGPCGTTANISSAVSVPFTQ